MPLPTTGSISLTQIETELFGTSGTSLGVNNVSFRLLASLGNNDVVLPSNSTIKWSDLRGKGVLRLTNSATTTNYNLRNSANSGGYGGTYIAGKTFINFTNSATIGGSSPAADAFTSGTFTSGDKVLITNNGYIVGAGGAGGSGQSAAYYADPGATQSSWHFTGPGGGTSGGDAMNISWPVTIANNGTIGGGGGGGQGGVAMTDVGPYGANNGAGVGGNGGGGGAGYTNGGAGPKGNASSYGNNSYGSDGNAGSLTTGGAQRQSTSTYWPYTSTGSAGGGLGQGGSNSAGRAVIGISNVTWQPIGTVLGATV